MIRCNHYYYDRFHKDYRSYMKIHHKWSRCYRCIKCNMLMHFVDVNKINHKIKRLNNSSIRQIPYFDDIRDDIVEADMPIDGQYTHLFDKHDEC